jgi:hypothetical protein
MACPLPRVGASHNLVFSHAGCNGDKGVNLAAEEHVERWLTRLDAHSTALQQLADAKHWHSELDKTLAAARAIYLRLPVGYLLWRAHHEFAAADRDQLKTLFAAAA